MTQPVSNGMSSSGESQLPDQITVEDHTCEPNDEADPLSDAVRQSVGDNNYQHWFSGRSRFELAGDVLRVFVPNPFIANWLLKRFRKQLTSAAAALLGPSGRFDLKVDEQLATESEGASKAGPASGRQKTGAKTRASDAALTDGSEGPRRPGRSEAVRQAGRRFRSFSGLVDGECNQLALMAAKQVAEFPGERFNPLYIHGPTGVGKTHLLEAIYTEVRRRHPELNVVYLTSEAFTNYFTQALSGRTVPSFRHRFRNVDVLLVDNIEFLDNKKATEEEFLHTIVQVVEHGGQLVVSGDRHPRLLTQHREELTTRFMSGLVCRMEVPCEDTRLRIAAALALPMREFLTPETVDYVARRCRRNVREIQGALNCLHGHSVLTGRRITISRAREILGEMQSECQRLVRISDVEKVVCEAFGLTPSDLRSKSRRRAVSCPRSLAMFVARKLTRCAYREIGLHFGGRDHSTVVAAEKRVLGWIQDDVPLELPSSCRGRTVAEVVEELENRLLSLAS